MRSLGVVPWSTRMFGHVRCLFEGKAVSWDRHGGSLVSKDVQFPQMFGRRESVLLGWTPGLIGCSVASDVLTKGKRSLGTGIVVP